MLKEWSLKKQGAKTRWLLPKLMSVIADALGFFFDPSRFYACLSGEYLRVAKIVPDGENIRVFKLGYNPCSGMDVWGEVAPEKGLCLAWLLAADAAPPAWVVVADNCGTMDDGETIRWHLTLCDVRDPDQWREAALEVTTPASVEALQEAVQTIVSGAPVRCQSDQRFDHIDEIHISWEERQREESLPGRPTPIF